jgi:hypothetical protein
VVRSLTKPAAVWSDWEAMPEAAGSRPPPRSLLLVELNGCGLETGRLQQLVAAMSALPSARLSSSRLPSARLMSANPPTALSVDNRYGGADGPLEKRRGRWRQGSIGESPHNVLHGR